MSNPFRVLSVNVAMMGHITFQNTLEQTFREHFPEVEFHSIRLLDRVRNEFLLRLLLRLSRVRLPGCRAESDWDYLRFRFEMGMSLAARLLLAGELRKARYDVVHLHTQAIALLASLPPLSAPYVVSLDYTSALFLRDRPNHPRHTLLPTVAAERRCFQHAAHIISWSERTRRSVVEDYAIPAEKVTVLPPGNPLPPEWMAAPRAKQHGGRVQLLFVGNDFSRKGGPELVEVFMRDFADRCELHIVSNGEFAAPSHPFIFVHRGVQALSVELLERYRAADIFVMPTHEEAFGMVFVEAMAAGLPCVGSTAMSVPEIVCDGVTGFNVPPGNTAALSAALRRLVEDSARRQTMGAAGRQRVETRFDPVQNGRIFLDVLKSASSMSKQPASAATR